MKAFLHQNFEVNS